MFPRPISLLDLRRRIEAGTLGVAAALEEARERIGAHDAALHAFVQVAPLPDAVPGAHLPLAGIAVGVKDIIDTSDMPTEMGLPAVWGGWRPRADAAVVGMVKAAGGWVAGKTVTTALANLDPAATVNPRAPERTPGGSSSGSAAAVAAGLVPLAIGTQTGGSVIRPASFCGVAAIKPSFRLLPTTGVKTWAWTLDTLGLFADGVADLAYALAAISGRAMPLPEDPGRVRFGVIVDDPAGPPEAAMAAALDEAARRLEAAGHDVRAVRLGEEVADGWHAAPLVGSWEARLALAWELREHAADIPPRAAETLAAAATMSAQDYDAVRGRSRRARTSLRGVFAGQGVDVLLTPSAPGEPPGREGTGDPRFNRLWTLLGVPCVNVPGLLSPGGLPLGLQVVAPFARDAVALSAASVVERVLRNV